MKKVMMFGLALSMMLSAPAVFAAEDGTAAGKIKEGYEDMKKNSKKAYRKGKDEVCELINGKMECKAKELKHKLENTKDEIKDKANDK